MERKINFTKEHKEKLETLAVKFLFAGTAFTGALGTSVRVEDLIYHSTIGTLQNSLVNIKRVIDSKESLDEWSLTANEQEKIDILKEQREFINLLIGYKKWLNEESGVSKERARLQKQLAELKASTMTPEDQIKAIEESLSKLG